MGETVTFYLFAYWHDSRWNKFVGATVKIWDLAHNLAGLGHDVTLFLPKHGFGSARSPVRIVEVPFFDIPYLRFLSYNVFLAICLTSSYLKRRPDVVYARRMGSIVPGIYAKLTRSVFFYEINDDPYRRDFHEGWIPGFRVRKLISEWQDEINLRLCQKAFVITKDILRKIANMNPRLAADKLIELPSGANTDLFKPMPARECRSRLSINSENSYVGFAGTLLKHQGVDVLIDAAHSIVAAQPSTIFVVIGEGPMKEEWLNRVTTQGIGSAFVFTGQVEYEDMPVWLGAMDICVAPFHDDAGLRSPVKIFDYMACGRPVVASRIHGTTDVFDQSGAIKLVSPGNAEMLAKAVVELLHNRQEARKLGQNGRAFVLEHFDRRSIAKRISDKAISCRFQSC
jgi:glycosyltransferase involved in cell wall biosynthesis